MDQHQRREAARAPQAAARGRGYLEGLHGVQAHPQPSEYAFAYLLGHRDGERARAVALTPLRSCA